MSGLSREVIKWLQALDLSYAIKNPKWDFSNGFLVAEILSRYFPKETKFNNWGQVVAFLKKHNIVIPSSEYEPVIYCAPGAAVQFVTKLYTILTKRPVKSVPANDAPAPEPDFMTPTASSLLRDTEIVRIPGDLQRQMKAQQVVTEHSVRTQEQRAATSTKLFQQQATTPSYPAAAATNRTGMGAYNPSTSSIVPPTDAPMVVTEVQVKALGGKQTSMIRQQRYTSNDIPAASNGRATSAESNIVRVPPSSLGELADAMPTNGTLNTPQPQSAQMNSTGSHAGLGNTGSLSGPSMGNVKPLLDTLSAALRPLLLGKAQLVQALDPRLQPFAALIEVAGAHETAAAEALDQLASRAPLCADTIARAPTEFWKLWRAVVLSFESLPDASPALAALCRLIKCIGAAVSYADPGLAVQLASDVVIPQTANLIVRNPGKRGVLADMIYGFARSEDVPSRLAVLRAARETVKDTHSFVGVVSAFAPLDLDAAQTLSSQAAANNAVGVHLDERLVDLYQYYALVGLSAPQVSSRVSALALISCLASVNGPHIDALLESCELISSLVSDDWWEVSAQLITVASKLLLHTASRTSNEFVLGNKQNGPAVAETVARAEEAAEVLLGLIGNVWQSAAASNKNVQQVALTRLARNLDAYPVLLSIYVPSLLAHPAAMRNRILPPPGIESDATKRTIAYVMGSASRQYEEEVITPFIPVTQFVAEYAHVLSRHKAQDIEANGNNNNNNNNLQSSASNHAVGSQHDIPQGWDTSHLEALASVILPVQFDSAFLHATVDHVNANRVTHPDDSPQAEYTVEQEIGVWLDALNRIKELIGAFLSLDGPSHDLAKAVVEKFIFSSVAEIRNGALEIFGDALVSTLTAACVVSSASNSSSANGGDVNMHPYPSVGGPVVSIRTVEKLMEEWLVKDEREFGTPANSGSGVGAMIIGALSGFKDQHPKLFAVSNLATLLHALKTAGRDEY